MAEEKQKEDQKIGALFIPAGLLLGFGVGFLFNNLVAWMFVGLGVGFLAFAITSVIKSEK